MFLISVAKVVRFSQSEAKANFENFGMQSEKKLGLILFPVDKCSTMT